MKLRRFSSLKLPSLKLTLLLISSFVLAGGGLYSVDRAYGQGEGSDQQHLPKATANIDGIIPSPKLLAPELSAVKGVLLSPLESNRPQEQLSQELAQVTPVNLCVDLPDWQRPSEQTQRKQLERMERYQGLSQDETLISLVKGWWTHEAFSFTTYGLSARTDPHYLSGIWTALDHIWDCYEGEQPQQINAGELAELWLMNHQLVSIQWQDNQYLVTVEPSSSGLQMLLFERQERYDTLPVVIRTAVGEEIAVMSGDW